MHHIPSLKLLLALTLAIIGPTAALAQSPVSLLSDAGSEVLTTIQRRYMDRSEFGSYVASRRVVRLTNHLRESRTVGFAMGETSAVFEKTSGQILSDGSYTWNGTRREHNRLIRFDQIELFVGADGVAAGHIRIGSSLYVLSSLGGGLYVLTSIDESTLTAQGSEDGSVSDVANKGSVIVKYSGYAKPRAARRTSVALALAA